MQKILIFGAGWLGNKYKDYLGATLSAANITVKKSVEKELDEYKPNVVINTAGKTGRPNIDWCEDHKIETIESNTIGPIVLMNACLKRNIHLVHLSSGCIFNGASAHTNGFTENDAPNPVSFYSWTKAWADEVLKNFPVLILRIRMPIDSLPSPRNLITKLSGYNNIIDVENSITIVDDLLFATRKLIQKKKTGIYNITNPEAVKHKDIMQWYKEIVDSNHKYTMIPAQDLLIKKIAKAGRSNCVLDTSKLQKEGIILHNTKDAIIACMKEYKKHL